MAIPLHVKTWSILAKRFMKEEEWLKFIEKENKPKTKIISVISKCSDCELGKIKWYPNWRHYCFFPTLEFQTVHSDRCLLSISKFITELNTQHKRGNRLPPTDKSTNIIPTTL